MSPPLDRGFRKALSLGIYRFRSAAAGESRRIGGSVGARHQLAWPFAHSSAWILAASANLKRLRAQCGFSGSGAA